MLDDDRRVAGIDQLLEQFQQAEMIRLTRSEGRRRSYILTPQGAAALEKEYARLCAQAELYRRIMKEGAQ